MTEQVELRACPVADGYGPCCRNCGGGWPGTRATTEQLTEAVNSGRLDDANKLGCAPLIERARTAIAEVRVLNSSGNVYESDR